MDSYHYNFSILGLFSKIQYFKLKITVFWATFALSKNVLDTCDIR